jgi:hypothetical protein
VGLGEEAADSKYGLVELPIREAPPPDRNGIARRGPLSHSEISPYSWIDYQRDHLRSGDR